MSTLPYIPRDTLALSFGGSRSLEGITHDQVRRFTDAARLPMNPVWRVVQETAERTADAWKKIEHKDLVPAATPQSIDEQIQRALAGADVK